VLLFKLNDTDFKALDDVPEAAMGLHIGSAGGKVVFVLGGMVLFQPGSEEVKHTNLMRRIAAANSSEWKEVFATWFREDLEDHQGELNLPKDQPAEFARVVAARTGVQSSAPITAGHLPFKRNTAANDVFYRCEPWPVSRRVLQSGNLVRPGTYAFPQSELLFVPTGFAAVGRYSLPNLLPGCFRWEIKPTKNCSISIGSSLPLFGLSGGGVEVCFPNGATNCGPIANPVQLPDY